MVAGNQVSLLNYFVALLLTNRRVANQRGRRLPVSIPIILTITGDAGRVDLAVDDLAFGLFGLDDLGRAPGGDVGQVQGAVDLVGQGQDSRRTLLLSLFWMRQDVTFRSCHPLLH